MVILPVIGEFLEYLDQQRNFSAHTIRGYQIDLQQFCRFLAGGALPTSEALDTDEGQEHLAPRPLTRRLLATTPTDMRAFLAALRSAGYSKSTVARKLATLRSFYKSLIRRGKLTTSPVAVVRTPKKDKRLPSCLDEAQVEALLSAPAEAACLVRATVSAVLFEPVPTKTPQRPVARSTTMLRIRSRSN